MLIHSSLIHSSLLTRAGFHHAFTTRAGGCSRPPFDTFNLGRTLGDQDDTLAANHQRLADAVGYRRLYEVSQVHSDVVVNVDRDQNPAVFRQQEADGLVLCGLDDAVAIGVRTADCVPLLIAHTPTGKVAAIHAGWRGVESGIIPKGIRRLTCPPAELIVAIGPHIRQPSFELGEDVAERLAKTANTCGAADVVDRQLPKPHVDLTAIVIGQLKAAGVTEIDDVGGCTYVEGQRFFSYRRDGDPTGRHLAVIMARSSSL